MIWHIVVESDSHIHHKYSEDVGTAKFYMIQYFLCIINVTFCSSESVYFLM